MASQRDVKNKIASVKNIQKITRAMEMVAAARLRRAEMRIEALRPYADALGRMTRQAARAAGHEAARLPLLSAHESEAKAGLLLITGDRGLAGGLFAAAQQVGISLGLAVLATIAAARTRSAAAHGLAASPALVSGYRLAYLVAAVNHYSGICRAHDCCAQRQEVYSGLRDREHGGPQAG